MPKQRLAPLALALAVASGAQAASITPPNLIQATGAANGDLMLVWPTTAGGPLESLSWANLKAQIQADLGSTWLKSANNLSDLSNTTAARTNLELDAPWQSVSFATGTGLFNLCDPSITSDNLSATIPAGNAITDFGACPSGTHKRIKNVGTTTIALVADRTHIFGYQPLGATGAPGGSGFSDIVPVQPGDVVDVVSLGSDAWQITNDLPMGLMNYGYRCGTGSLSDAPAFTWFGVGPLAGNCTTSNIPVTPFAVGWGMNEMKIYSGGARFTLPGDTPNIAFFIADVNSADGSAKPWTSAPYLGSHIAGQPVVDKGGGVYGFANNTVAGAPGSAFQGFNADIAYPIIGVPTTTSTPGAIVFSVTAPGTVTHFDRMWLNGSTGDLVLQGSGAWEACGATYPYSAGSILASKSPCADSDYYDTPGYANLTLIGTDYTSAIDHDNAAIAIRRFGAHTEGLDIGMTGGAGTDVMTVHSGTRTVVEHFDPATSQVTMPAQVAVSAYVNATISNVTGDGTVYFPVVFNATNLNQGSAFNTSTGVFTAPVAGMYEASYCLQLTGLTTSDTVLQSVIVTTLKNYQLFAGAAKPDSGGTQSVCGTATAYMAATDTLSIFLKISGSTKTVGVAGGTGAGNSGLSYLTVRLAG